MHHIRCLATLTLLSAVGCAGWSSTVAQRADPPRAPMAASAKVALAGGPFRIMARTLGQGAALACDVALESAPTIHQAHETIDWQKGVMGAPPLHHVATLQLKNDDRAGDPDFDAMKNTIEEAARAVGANMAIVHKETMIDGPKTVGLVVEAYFVDCDAVQQASTTTST